MANCLVTGGAGFIGSNIVDRLIKDGHSVSIIDNLSTGKEENINPKAKFFKVDITSPDAAAAFKDVNVVFHTAAKARVQPSIEDPVGYCNVNTRGTLNMLKMAVDAGAKRFVYSASSSAYGTPRNLPQSETEPTDPLSPYGVQKLVGELYSTMFNKVYGLETVSLRYFNVYGERQVLKGAYSLVMGIFANQALNGEPMTIYGDGEQRRDFTYVGDVVDANVRAAFSEKVGNGEVINVGNGDNRSVNQLADMIGGERVHLEPRIEPMATLADNSKARELLGWKPTMKIEDWVVGYKKGLGL
jgi:UDP-glucose 4-epimerase